MANRYEPSEEEKKLITFVSDRFKKARDNFNNNQKKKFDLYYKNSMNYTGDRQALLDQQGKGWASNTFVPLTTSFISGVLPKVTDSSPELKVTGRNPDDMGKAEKVQTLLEYIWDKNPMEKELRAFNLQALRYGTSVAKIYWKSKTVKSTKEVIDDKDLEIKSTVEIKDEFNDPTFETVDIYNFYPDPQGYTIDNCRYVCQRYLMTKEQIYSTYGKDNLNNTEYLKAGTGDLTIFSDVRDKVNSNKNSGNVPKATNEQIEVIEYWEDDKLVVIAGDVLLRNEPNPLPFKKKPFVKTCYEDVEFQFYGIGIAEQLVHPQELINKIRNQRIDNVTMALQQMYIVNDIALINKNDLDFRPGGIIRVRGQDMGNVVQPLPSPGINGTSYNEDELIMQSAQQATGLDSYSIGQTQAASTSASAVIATKEASALRVKGYIRSLETDIYEPVIRMWLELAKSFYPNDVIVNIYDKDGKVIGQEQKIPLDISRKENGSVVFESIKKDDLMGYFNFRVLSDSGIAASKELAKANALQLLDRAASIGTNPQSGEQYVDIKALWESTISSFGLDSEKIMGFNSQKAQQRQEESKQLIQEQNQLAAEQGNAKPQGNPLANQLTANLGGSNAPTQNVAPNQQR